MRWSPLLIMVLAGCLQSPAPAEVAVSDEAPVDVEWMVTPFAYDGRLSSTACMPNPAEGGCLAPVVLFGESRHKLMVDHRLDEVVLRLEWTPLTAASEQLRLSVRCATDCDSVVGLPHRVQGASPLSIDIAEIGLDPFRALYIDVRPVNLMDDSGTSAFIEDGTAFRVEGEAGGPAR